VEWTCLPGEIQMAELIILVVLGTSVWVLVDARHIGVKKGHITGFFNMGPMGWFFSCLLLWIVPSLFIW
jgi:hypothetical protein